MPHLTDAQLAAYRDDGFLFPVPVMEAEEAAALRAEFEDWEDRWLEEDLPLPLNTYKRINAHVVSPLAARLARDPRILDAVEGVLGPDILAYSVEFFIKEAGSPAIVSMHQDLTYWGLGATQGLVTVWLALSPATRASGAMEFVRGSHRNAILPHEDTENPDNLLSRGQEIRVEVAEADRTPAELRPGDISLHHGLMIHGSGPNVSDDRRIACAIRYMRPDVRQQVASADYAMLVRGADRAGNFIHVAPPDEDFSPAALALHAEIRKVQAEAMMAGTRNAKGLYA